MPWAICLINQHRAAHLPALSTWKPRSLRPSSKIVVSSTLTPPSRENSASLQSQRSLTRQAVPVARPSDPIQNVPP